jgi:hypothetical protein
VVDFPLARLQIHVEEGAIVVEVHGAGTEVSGGGEGLTELGKVNFVSVKTS